MLHGVMPLTIKEAYQSGVQKLRVRDGDGEARATMRHLLEAVTGVANAGLLQPDRSLNDVETAFFMAALQQLSEGRPLAYVLGSIEFCGLEFHCDERALIPRPETELLVEAVLGRLKAVRAPLIADLGTGSGCIAVSLAHARADARLFATDISPASLHLAGENARRHGLAERIAFVDGRKNEWAAPIAHHAPFDAIVSNPPYIASSEIRALQSQVQHEPRLALDGGKDGLDPYRELAIQCPPLLNLGGFVACELGAGQFADVRQIFQTFGWHVAKPIVDFGGHERVLCAHR